jgi:poly(beta-D-mannuronate) lyase
MIRLWYIFVPVLAIGAARAETGGSDPCPPSLPLSATAPVLSRHRPASNAIDRAAEPFALFEMLAAANWRGHHHAAAAEDAVGEMLRWARAGTLGEIVEVGPEASNTNSAYALRRALIALLGAWFDLRSSPAGQRYAAEIEPWLQGLVERQDVATGGARQRTSAAAVSNRNNHVLLRATIEAQVALQAARPDLARRAYERARATLAGMRPDGSLPLETARGRRALWYQRHALASLVYIGDLLAPFGLDIWQPRADGADLHRAVAFLVQAIDRPELLAPYVGADDIRQQDLGFLRPRNNGRHYMAWALLYRARFPARDEAAALARWLPVAGQPGWPLVDDYVGGNATCRVFTATP